jgi:hypothetical protein
MQLQTALLAVLAPFTLVLGAQSVRDRPQLNDPPDEETLKLHETPFGKLGDATAEQKLKALLGTWRLRLFTHSEADIPPETVTGWMVFDTGHAAMIFHASEEVQTRWELRVQSFVGQFRFNADDRLQIVTQLGHTNFEEGEIENEPRGYPREYDVRLIGVDTVQLRRPDGSRFTFERVRPSPFSPDLIRAIEESRRTDRAERGPIR